MDSLVTLINRTGHGRTCYVRRTALQTCRLIIIFVAVSDFFVTDWRCTALTAQKIIIGSRVREKTCHNNFKKFLNFISKLNYIVNFFSFRKNLRNFWPNLDLILNFFLISNYRSHSNFTLNFVYLLKNHKRRRVNGGKFRTCVKVDDFSWDKKKFRIEIAIEIGCWTSEEVWLNNIVDYAIIKIFGCPCYLVAHY